MDEQQCTDLTKHLIRGVLPKMGVVRTANTILAMTPCIYRGFGIINLYIQQMIGHLKVISNHSGASLKTGTLLQIELK